MRVEIIVSCVKTRIVEVDADRDSFREDLLASEADALLSDASVPLEWDHTTFEDPDAGPDEDSHLGETK